MPRAQVWCHESPDAPVRRRGSAAAGPTSAAPLLIDRPL